MFKKSTLLMAAVLTLLSAPSFAQDETKDLASMVFSSVDFNQDGNLSSKEVLTHQDTVFLSMDENEDQSISKSEFRQWDTVWQFYATEKGSDAEKAMKKAKKQIFKNWDLNKDGRLAEWEHEHSILLEYITSESDGKVGVSLEEFSKNFSMAKEFTAAIDTK